MKSCIDLVLSKSIDAAHKRQSERRSGNITEKSAKIFGIHYIKLRSNQSN